MKKIEIIKEIVFGIVYLCTVYAIYYYGILIYG